MEILWSNPKNFGGRRKDRDIKYIVVHYTGNDGDSARGNANYFKNNVVEVSAHYFVDDAVITHTVPDLRVAWHCGADKYYCGARNTNSIGIEMCDTLKNGKYELSAKTRKNTITLIRALMKRYNIPISNVVRHFDVSRKKCPAYFVENPAAWEAFKKDITYVPPAPKPACKKGDALQLKKEPLYASSTAKAPCGTKTGTYYVYDGKTVNGRLRVTVRKSYCGKAPAGLYVTGWVKKKEEI